MIIVITVLRPEGGSVGLLLLRDVDAPLEELWRVPSIFIVALLASTLALLVLTLSHQIFPLLFHSPAAKGLSGIDLDALDDMGPSDSTIRIGTKGDCAAEGLNLHIRLVWASLSIWEA